MGLRGSCKRLAAVAAAGVCALALCGCGASLTVYDYTEDGVRYNEFTLEISRGLVDDMERTAIPDEYGNGYTVAGYFYELFDDCGCVLVDSSDTEDGYRAVYRKAYGGTPELFDIGVPVEYSYEYTQNPFARYVTATAANPFNGVRAAYDGVLPGQSGTLIQQLRNGKIAVDEYGERVVLFPSVQTAFPYLAGLDPSGLKLAYARDGSVRMRSSGRTESGATHKFVFERYFDDAETNIALFYTRPVAYGWYIVAVLAGGATVGAIALATRKRKKPVNVKDKFPYDPEDFFTHNNNLPM